MQNMAIQFILLLLTMAALQTHTLFTGQKEGGREKEREMQNMVINFFSLTRNNKFFNCPEVLFLKGVTGALAPFSNLVYYKDQDLKRFLTCMGS